MNEQEFINKVLAQWDTAYSAKVEQKELLKIILNKIKILEETK